MSGRNLYLSEPAHREFGFFYEEGREGGLYLAFTVPWRKLHLPLSVVFDHFPGDAKAPKGRSYPELCNALLVYLRDTEDGKVYKTYMMPSWEDGDDAGWDEWQNHTSLNQYFYGSHHCQCHRKCDAKAAGAVTDEECEGERFMIERIVYKGLPDLILASETLDLVTLEEILTGKREYGE